MLPMLIAAGLLSISISCAAYYILYRRNVKTIAANRVAETSQHLSFPYQLEKNQNSSSKAEEMTLSDSLQNKTARSLYLAGFRSKKSVSYFNMLIMISYFVPVFVIASAYFTGDFSMSVVVKACLEGFGFNFVIRFFINGRRKKLEQSMIKTLPQFMDLLIIAIEAGLNFTSALPRVLQELEPDNPLVKQFNTVHHEYLGGFSIGQACDRAAKRCDFPDLSVIMSAIVESEETGSSLAHVLRIHAHELRDKYRQRLRERAHKIPVKLVFPMLLVFITIFVFALGPTLYSMKSTDLLTPSAKKPAASSTNTGSS